MPSSMAAAVRLKLLASEYEELNPDSKVGDAEMSISLRWGFFVDYG